VANGRVEARPLVTVSLAADHRVTDGHIGARLLSAIERLLQEPDKL
jgi:pyruvate dehydrogenase E2 component (dihydrolipoamide acetyltransferase)